jgi:ABC-type lipoprotein export system ATPase subunit
LRKGECHVIELRGICKRYDAGPGRPVVAADDVSLTPTGNVDADCGAGILDLLAGLRIEHTMTVVLASHDPRVAARCERLIRLTGGRVASDIELTGGESPASILRRISQLG